jgi:hypothetical protein
VRRGTGYFKVFAKMWLLPLSVARCFENGHPSFQEKLEFVPWVIIFLLCIFIGIFYYHHKNMMHKWWQGEKKRTIASQVSPVKIASNDEWGAAAKPASSSNG